jgi:hypothetical protein
MPQSGTTSSVDVLIIGSGFRDREGIQPGFSSEYWWKSRRINEADFVMG